MKNWKKILIVMAGLWLLGTLIVVATGGLDGIETAEKTENALVTEAVTETERLTHTELLDKYNNKIMIRAESYLEDLEKVRIKKNLIMEPFTVVIYNSEPVQDQSGVEFPFSYAISGNFDVKETGEIREFMMTLGYKNLDDLKENVGHVIQYLSSSDTYFNAMADEFDAWKNLGR